MFVLEPETKEEREKRSSIDVEMFGESLIQSWLRSIMTDQSHGPFLRNIISCVSAHLSLLIFPTECVSVLKWIDSPGTEQPPFHATRHLYVCRIIIGRILPL